MTEQKNILGAFMVPHPPIIVHEVGQGREEPASATIKAYQQTAKLIAELKPETIILLSPHSILYSDYFHVSPGKGAYGDFKQFRAENVKFGVEYDEELTAKICENAGKSNFPAGIDGDRQPELDHGTMVPLYFINKEFIDYKLVRIGLSGLSLMEHYTFGMMIQKAVEELNRRVVIVASGDLSHVLKEDGPYGYKKEGPEYDKRLMSVMEAGAFDKLLEFPEKLCSDASECGHRSFVIMSGILNGYSVVPQKLSYEGPFGVGYGICTYQPGEKSGEREFMRVYKEKQAKKMTEIRAKEDEYIRLARLAIETHIKNRKEIAVPDFATDEMKNRRAGVFVSIHKNGMLRGCIGTIKPFQKNIAEEIIKNAMSASTEDPRFSPITDDELDILEISVDVLGDTEEISSEAELDVKRYGVIVTKGRRRGLLLPNLDGVRNVEEQISIARQKAGILPYENEVRLERFEVIRHEAADSAD